jgi:hypothetical protein
VPDAAVLQATILSAGGDLGNISIGDAISFAGQVTGNVAMFLGLIALIRGWIYPKYVVTDLKERVKELQKERDDALDLVRSANGIARSGTQTNERLAVATKETTDVLAVQVAALLRQSGAQGNT